ncbi:MAG: (Fe-S)-binding protein, partial [Pseudomonadota bacterium]
MARPTPEPFQAATDCIRCGRCMSVCPIYGRTKNEWDSPRGKMSLVDAYTGDRKGLYSLLSRCLACGACETVCANQVPCVRKILAGREAQTKKTGTGWIAGTQVAALTDTGPGPELLRKGGRLFQALACREVPGTSGLHLRFPLEFFSRHKIMPRLARRPFLYETPERIAPQGSPRARAALFVGCGANHVFTSAATAFVQLATASGAEVLVPRAQECCGLADRVSGDREGALRQAVRFLEVFGGLEAECIVTLCASCASQIVHLPLMFPKDSPKREKALDLASRHVEASDFLLSLPSLSQRLREGATPVGGNRLKVHYHAPCHLRFGPATTTGPRDLLALLPGMELATDPDQVSCCGHGGSFNLRHQELSSGILEGCLANLEGLPLDAVVTGCTGCLVQLSEGLALGQE